VSDRRCTVCFVSLYQSISKQISGRKSRRSAFRCLERCDTCSNHKGTVVGDRKVSECQGWEGTLAAFLLVEHAHQLCLRRSLDTQWVPSQGVESKYVWRSLFEAQWAALLRIGLMRVVATRFLAAEAQLRVSCWKELCYSPCSGLA
jgi:hypothetical protein